jgi:hypothetical protein
MSEEKFVFQGQTTFINRPANTVIHDFQNNYIRGDGSTADQINLELKRLIELSLTSGDLPDNDKEEVVEAIHSVAGQVREGKANRITLKGTLEAIQSIVAKAADVAGPAIAIITTVLKLAGIG